MHASETLPIHASSDPRPPAAPTQACTEEVALAAFAANVVPASHRDAVTRTAQPINNGFAVTVVRGVMPRPFRSITELVTMAGNLVHDRSNSRTQAGVVQ